MKNLFILILTISLVLGLLSNFSVLTYAFDDAQFEWVLPPNKWRHIQTYQEGYAVIADESAEGRIESGFIDRFGKITMLPFGYSLSPFVNGISTAARTKSGSGLVLDYAYFNQNFEIVETFSNAEQDERRKAKEAEKPTITIPKYSNYPVELYEGYAVIRGKMEPTDEDEGWYVIDKEGNPCVRLYDPNDRYSYHDYKTSFGISDDASMIWIRGGSPPSNYGTKVKAFPFAKDPAILDGVSFFIDFDNPIALLACKDDKWGAFDLDFNLIIPFEYEMLGNEYDPGIADGIINAKKDGKWGYIDFKNNVIVDFQFAYATKFSEGRGIVGMNGRVGAEAGLGIIRIANDGEIYNPSKNVVDYAQATKIKVNSAEENAYIIGENIYLPIEILKNYGFEVKINASGRMIEIWKHKEKFKNIIPIIFEEKEIYEVLETDAKIFSEKTIYPAMDIEGITAVNINDLVEYGTVWEKNGEVHFAIDEPYLPNEGITWEFVKYSEDMVDNSKRAQQEEAKKEPEYPLLKVEGRVHAGSGSYSAWGTVKYYDENDNLVLDDDWSDAHPFSNGTALVMKGGTLQRGGMYGGKWGLIDTNGNYLVECIWDSASKTEDGYITYSINVETDGEKVHHSWAADPRGNTLTADEYRQFRLDHYGNYYFIEKDGLKGVVDVDGQTVLPFIFSLHDVSVPSSHISGSFDAYEEYCSITTYKNNSTYYSNFVKFIEKPILLGGVFINNEKVEFDTPPLLINNRTMIPVRAVFEKMGCTVEWIEDSNTAVIIRGDMRVEIKQDTNVIIKNGDYIYSDTAAINYNNRIHVPLRVISEALGCNVAYNDATGNVTIDY